MLFDMYTMLWLVLVDRDRRATANHPSLCRCSAFHLPAQVGDSHLCWPNNQIDAIQIRLLALFNWIRQAENYHYQNATVGNESSLCISIKQYLNKTKQSQHLQPASLHFKYIEIWYLKSHVKTSINHQPIFDVYICPPCPPPEPSQRAARPRSSGGLSRSSSGPQTIFRQMFVLQTKHALLSAN